MKSTAARRSARPTLGATRPWITAGCATAQWKARFARRYPPPLEPPLANRAFYSFCGAPNPCPNPCLLDGSLRSNHHRFDPRKQTPGGRHQIGTPAGFKSESVAGFLLECAAGFVGICTLIYQLLERRETGDVFADLEALLDQVSPYYKARVEEYATARSVRSSTRSRSTGTRSPRMISAPKQGSRSLRPRRTSTE